MTADLTVLYDADCGLCTHVARALARLDTSRRLELVSLQTADLPDMPPRTELLDALRAVDASGHWSVGAAAGVEIAKRVPLLWPLSAAAKLPFAMPILDLYYHLVADNRQSLSRLLGLNVCRVRRP